MRDDLESRPEQLEIVHAIERSVNSLNHVVTNILQFAHRHAKAFVPTSLSVIIQELCSEFRKVYPNIDISFRGFGELYVWGDGQSLRQLFYNLFLNAVQAQGSIGSIRIVAHETPESTVVRIRDEGPGVPEELLHDIFEPFITSKNEGTGLGLAICQEIARAHGAELSASNWRSGAQFIMKFTRRK